MLLPFVPILAALLIASSLPLKAHELPELGDVASSMAFTPQEEFELGREIMNKIQHSMGLYHDIVVNEYLRGMGARLIAPVSQAQPNYHFFAIKDKAINAGAFPGGFIAINSGLVTATESESELAGVMAHEVAHVQQRHLARLYAHMQRIDIPSLATLITGLIFFPQAGSGILATTMAGREQMRLNFTRDHEKEADFIGMQNLVKAGFDPMGMPAFFERLHENFRYDGRNIPEYLLTHPYSDARAAMAKSRAKTYPYKQIPDSLYYHIAQARTLAHEFNAPYLSVAYFKKRLENGTYRSYLGTLYGYSLSLLEAGQYEQAYQSAKLLLKEAPNQPLFQLLYAQIEMANHQPEAAMKRLVITLKNHPKNFSVLHTYSQWLIHQGATDKAIQLLKRQLVYQPNPPEIWKLLSQAYEHSHQIYEGHMALAHFYKLNHQPKAAIMQFKLAKNLKLSHAQAQHVEAEIKLLERLVKNH